MLHTIDVFVYDQDFSKISKNFHREKTEGFKTLNFKQNIFIRLYFNTGMKYLLIINPISGKKDKKAIITKIEKRFFPNIETVFTQEKDHAITIAKQSTHDIIILCSGDGTVNEVVNGIMLNKKKKAKLCVIPVGTSNMFARSIGMAEKSVGDILELIAAERSRKIDVGKANTRYFAIACGVGFDAHAYKNVQPELKRIVGEAAYPLALLKSMVDYKAEELVVDCSREKKLGYYVLVANMARFHRFFTLIKDSSDYDGYFDVLIFQKKNLLDNLRYLYGILSQQHHKFKDVEHIHCKELLISSSKPVLAHTDAEANGTTPIKITMAHKGLEIIC